MLRLPIAAALALAPLAAHAAEVTHVPMPPRPGGPATPPPYSAAVIVGDTVYLAGNTDGARRWAARRPMQLAASWTG